MMHILFVLIGTTGAGKTMLSGKLKEAYPRLKRIRSCTTRPRRNGEPEDAYHFLTRAQFEEAISQGRFVEYDSFGSNLYGRRWEDFTDLRAGPCFADMTESGLAALQGNEQFQVVAIRISPLNITRVDRAAARAEDDARRERVTIRVDHEIVNDHAQANGKTLAFAELRTIIDNTLRQGG